MLSRVSVIAEKELQHLIYSPIGWIVFVVFWFQAGSQFLLSFDMLIEATAVGRSLDSYAERLFTSSFQTVTQFVINNAFLYIPLITMGIYSREFASGSINLLVSSPVNATEIVLGKLLGILVYFLGFVAAIFLFVLVSAFAVVDFDLAATMPSLLGLFLLIFTYGVIGQFISSLTGYQVVAAIVTFAVLFALSSVSEWFRAVPVLNEVTYWISLSGRAESLRSGLIATDNVAYFAVIIIVFVGFTVLRIRRLRTGESLTSVSVKGAAILSACVAIGLVLSLPQLTRSFDTTYDRRNSLAQESVELMERLEGPWSITTYANVVDRMGFVAQPKNRVEDKNRYRAYRAFNPQLSMDYELFYDVDASDGAFVVRDTDSSAEEAVRKWSQRSGLNPDDVIPGYERDALLNDVDLASEEYRSFRVIEWQGKTAILRHFYDSVRFPDERTRAAAIRILLDGPVVVSVLSGNGERSVTRNGPRDYEMNFTRKNDRHSLINNGAEFMVGAFGLVVNESTDIVMIADPKRPYSATEVDSLMDELARGTDMMLLLEADSDPSLAPIMAYLGLETGSELNQDHGDRFEPGLVFAEIQEGVLDQLWGDGNRDLPVALDGVVELRVAETNGYSYLPILKAPKTAFRVSEHSATPNEAMVTGYALTREVSGEEQRILVFGDADIFSNVNAERRRPFTTKGIAMESLHWLTNEAFPVQRTRRELIDGTLAVSEGFVSSMRWVLLGIVPLILSMLGGWLLVSRARR